MEYKIDKVFLRELCKTFSGAMVGKLCKQNESLQAALESTSLPESERKNLERHLEIIKNFNRELVYESFRDFSNHIKFYNQGRVYEKYKIYKPTK